MCHIRASVESTHKEVKIQTEDCLLGFFPLQKSLVHCVPPPLLLSTATSVPTDTGKKIFARIWTATQRGPTASMVMGWWLSTCFAAQAVISYAAYDHTE